MANKTYNIEEVKAEASDFLKIKKDRNKTTYLNYRTSINYFIYYLENIAEVEVLGTDNKDKVLEGFQGSLLAGFIYIVNDIERTVKVKANGVNTHVRRIRTFLNKCLGLPVEVNKLKVDRPKYKSLTKAEVELLITECFNYWFIDKVNFSAEAIEKIEEAKQKKRKYYLTIEEIAELEIDLPELQKFKLNNEIAIRNATLIKFLFNTAFRIEEALGIKTSDIYEENSNYFVKIHEKGKASGVLTEVIISAGTYFSLMDYVNIKAVPSDFIFSSVKASDNGKAKAFNRQNFNRSIIELASYVDVKYKGIELEGRPVNISKVVENNSSHVFRHSKATYLLNVKKEDVVTVKEVLRHSSIDSTLIYLNPKEEAINKVRTSNDI